MTFLDEKYKFLPHFAILPPPPPPPPKNLLLIRTSPAVFSDYLRVEYKILVIAFQRSNSPQTGKLQEYELGKWFRKRYEKPLNISDYEVDEIRMDSSNSNRTIMSAELVLAGFYPPNKRDEWNNDGLGWQPVPVHSISDSVDNVSQ